MAETATPTRPFRYRTGMLVATGAACALPIIGLVVLLQRPRLDVHLEHHPGHFWLVLLAGATSAVLAYTMSVAAERRLDPRVLLVAIMFLAAAGFLGLHALATPGVLLRTPNAGFTSATPVGIGLGSLAALASSLDLRDDQTARAIRIGRGLRLALVALLVAWAVASLARLPPLQGAGVPEQASAILVAIAVPSVIAYAVAAWRYLRLWRQRPSLMMLSIIAAFVLLAEAMVAVVFARNWALSWWEWHLLLLAAFGLVGLGARIQWYQERYADLYTDATVAGRREVSVVFADLEGFTSFAERHRPDEVTGMLNTYFEVAVPPVVRQFGGEVDRIIGDALMITFNRRGDQPDHAVRAARAGLELQAVTRQVAARHRGWPRFRVGVNSGPVLVSLLGTEGARTYTVIGDTVNVAARVQTEAPSGSVAVTSATLAQLPGAVTEPLGRLGLRGKEEPIDVHLLRDLGPEPPGS